MEKFNNTDADLLMGGVHIFSTNGSGFIVDNMGLPVTRGSIIAMIRELQKGLERNSTEDINEHEEQVLLERYPFMYEQVTGKQLPMEHVLEERERRQREREEQRKRTRPGYVYVLQSEHGYKIGRTADVKQRSKAFQSLPFPVEMIITIEVQRMDQVEKYFHERFADKRIVSEWFQLEEDDLRFIRAYREGSL